MILLLELARSNLLRVVRNRSLLFSTIFFPLIFIGVFGIAFQSGQITTSPVEIGVLAMDSGIPADATMYNHSGEQVEQTQLQRSYLDLLVGLTYDDNQTHIFEITPYNTSSEDTARKLMEQGELAGLLYIPSDFSLGLMAAFRGQYQGDPGIVIATNNWQDYPAITYQTEVRIMGDQSLQGFGIASSVISQLTTRFFDFDQLPQAYRLEIDGSVETDKLTAFDFVLPGLVVFGLMQTLGVVASTALHDVDSGLMDRLKITSMRQLDYVGALILSQLLVSTIQIPIFFGTAILFGFPVSIQILWAFLFAILISLSMTGLGLIIASLADEVDASNTIAAMVSTPMAFLAGAFFIVPNPTLIENVGGQPLGILDFLPPTTAIEGLRLVLIAGRSLAEVSYHLLMLSGLTALLLVVGLLLYSRKHFTLR